MIRSFLLNNGRPFLFGGCGSSPAVSDSDASEEKEEDGGEGAFRFGCLLLLSVALETIESVDSVPVVWTELDAKLTAASLTSVSASIAEFAFDSVLVVKLGQN